MLSARGVEWNVDGEENVNSRSWSCGQCKSNNHLHCEKQMQEAQEGRCMMDGEVIDDGWSRKVGREPVYLPTSLPCGAWESSCAAVVMCGALAACAQ